ncbi:MAG: exodeoxyribonuclease VII large subunit [Candidatus Eisenbacteria sp.]|nr:exodeoxyribonuclease VII large subunit [Candidatus Eisenbacteria bacterium]
MQQRLSVSEATALVKESLETSLAPLWVEGEVSNFVAHRSGHFYFSLKDAAAQLRCVMFRGANCRLRFRPQDGLQCVAFGRITVYERSGQYQLIAERLLPVGAGELQAAFEALKSRLANEGLFDPARKQRLPAFPRAIGIATSPTGAAIRDLQRVLRRRWPAIRLILRPTRVQGPGAAEEIAAAIEQLSRREELDLLIVGRGGGSLEDLWAFNEEVVARAIAASRLPVISAVGHAVDETIADYVADLRAPTPSAAAELAVPDVREVRAALAALWGRAPRAAGRRIETVRLRVAALGGSHALQSPLDRMRQASQRADELLARMQRAAAVRLQRAGHRLAAVTATLAALSPQAVVARGYALAFDAGERLVTRVVQVEVGGRLDVRLADGTLRCRIEERTCGGGMDHAAPRGAREEHEA